MWRETEYTRWWACWETCDVRRRISARDRPTVRYPVGPSSHNTWFPGNLSRATHPPPQNTNKNTVVDPAYVGRASPIGSAVEGGAYDAAGGLTPAGAAAIQNLALARTIAGSGSLFSGMGADGVAALGGNAGGSTSYVAGTKELAAAADPAAVAAHDAAVLAVAERARAAAATAAAMQAEAATRPLTAATAGAGSMPPTVIEQQQPLAEEAAAAASPAAAPADLATTTTEATTLPPLSTLIETATTRLTDTTRPLPSASEATGFVADAASRLAAAAGTGVPANGAPHDDAELLSAVVAAAAAGMAARLQGGGAGGAP